MSLRRHAGQLDLELLMHDCPEIVRKPKLKAKKLKKRGSRGGIRAGLRKLGAQFLFPLESLLITLSIVRSLNNK